MRVKAHLAILAAATFLLVPNGRAQKIEEKAAGTRKTQSERIDLDGLTAKAYAGNANAQYSLAVIYEEGHGGIKKDLAYALSWYEEAARNGFKAASRKIRELHDHAITE